MQVKRVFSTANVSVTLIHALAPLSQAVDGRATIAAPGNSESYNLMWARPDARVGGVGHYPDFIRKKPS